MIAECFILPFYHTYEHSCATLDMNAMSTINPPKPVIRGIFTPFSLFIHHHRLFNKIKKHIIIIAVFSVKHTFLSHHNNRKCPSGRPYDAHAHHVNTCIHCNKTRAHNLIQIPVPYKPSSLSTLTPTFIIIVQSSYGHRPVHWYF